MSDPGKKVDIQVTPNLCDEKDIELVLFKSPNATQWKNAYSEKMNEYAKENDIS